jgi:C4-dicarboxylate-specific signal transduction histidine kinase
MSLVTDAGHPLPVLVSSSAIEISGGHGISVVATDLTQHKLNQEVVASERLARSIIEQAGEAIIVCDEGGTIIQASRLAQTLCGENPLLQPFDQLFELRIADTEATFSVAAPLTGGCFESMEVGYQSSDTVHYDLLLNATPLKGARDRRIIGCVVTLTDCTALKASDRLLRESGVQIQAANRCLQMVNEELQAANEELQVQGEELQEQNQELARAWEASRRAEEELQNAHDELDLRVKERTEALASTVENLREEIVERGRAEERSRRLNRIYAVLSETNQAIVRTRDRDALFQELCGISVREGGFKLAWVSQLEKSGELRSLAAAGATGYLDNITITANLEPAGLGPTGISLREGTYFVCNDFLESPITRPWHEKGRIYGMRASASIALKEEGRVIGALTLYADKKDFFDTQQVELLRQVGTDVSFALDNMVRENRRMKAEQALREATAERLRISETLREKEQMLIQQSRLAAMGEMIGNIAHQWRQPLNLLGLTVQRLPIYYELGECDGKFLGETVDKAMELIQHMSKTIDDFRNYFKPEREKVRFKVRDVIDNTLTLLKGTLQSPLIKVEIIGKDDPVIHGYPNEFGQVLINLVVNAKDVLVERAIDTPTVTITTVREAHGAVITVADNGGGIPEDVMGKIFDPYFTTKGEKGGTGVGLFMSKTIIEKNMGGKLTVRNNSCGAEFRIEV